MLKSSSTVSSSTTSESNISNIFQNFQTILRRQFNHNQRSNSSNSTVEGANSVSNETPSSAPAATTALTVSGAIQPVSSSLAAGELPLPHHLIAPPTYNQTMGLVDEYERRQLAFIEHVRTILSQQQQQGSSSTANGGTGIISLTSGPNGGPLSIIPTVTSSSTTVHRVTSSGRRHGSSRHHRHHHHHHQHRSSSHANGGLAEGASGSVASGNGSQASWVNSTFIFSF